VDYYNLSRLLNNELSYELELAKEESLRIINSSFEGGGLNKEKVKEEFNLALNDSNINWVEFAFENKFIWEKDTYLDNDVVYELNYILWDFLNPELAITKDDWNELLKLSIEIMKLCKKNDGWLESSDLFNILERLWSKTIYYNVNFLTEAVAKGELEARKNVSEDKNGYKRYNFSYRYIW